MTRFQINRDAAAASHAEAAVGIDDDATRRDYWLDVALEDSFPCSDPISSTRVD
ncbi:MAG: hypothetical protein V7632_3187 [Bradyrhizobium sp.]|jgi:hypothetical protein